MAKKQVWRGEEEVGDRLVVTTTVRLSPALRRRIDAWADRHDPRPSLSQSIRRLIAIGLESTSPTPSRTIPISRLNASNDR